MSKMSKEEINPFGIALLLLSLFFDGLLSTQSDIEKGKGTKTHAFHLMVSNNLVGLIFGLAGIAMDF